MLRKKKRHPVVFLLAALTIWLYGEGCVNYGKTGGAFRGKFWHYYERGLSFAEDEFWENAAEDFKAAIDKRGRDEQRVRIFGMHYMSYFPHRELGICYYRLGHLKDAERELSLSLESVETDKALYFLNLVKEAIALGHKDVEVPQIVMSAPGESSITNRSRIKVAGVVEDDVFVSEIRVNGLTIDIASDKKVFFEQNVRLRSGKNTIVVEAQDLNGKIGSESIEVILDQDGPVLQVEQPIEGMHTPRAKVAVVGKVVDRGGIQTLKVGGREVEVDQGGAFITPVDLEIGANEIALVALDDLGNKTEGRILVNRIALGGGAGIVKTGMERIDVTNRTRPDIHLDCFTTDQIVSSEPFPFGGRVTDDAGVKELKINGEALRSLGAKLIFFQRWSELEVGKNLFHVEAIGVNGRKASKAVVVERLRPVDAKLRVAVPDFFMLDADPSVKATGLNFKFSHALDLRGRFRVVTRERSVLQLIIDELKLDRSGMVDPKSAVRAGKLSGCEAIFVGHVTKKVGSIEIGMQLVDVESGEIILTKDIFGEGNSERKIQHLLDRLARDFERSMPVLEGVVIGQKGQRLLVNLGTRDGIWRRARVIFFRERDTTTLPTKKIGLRFVIDEIGKGIVEKVFERTCEVVLQDGINISKIEENDKVITK